MIESKYEVFRELLEQSQNERRGLTFFIQGQTLVGTVTRIIGTKAVEVRSQMFSKAIVLINSIDAVAIT